MFFANIMRGLIF